LWRSRYCVHISKVEKKLTDDDPNREAVLALVDVRLDVIDGILTYAALRGER
jgi:hypothetical protein